MLRLGHTDLETSSDEHAALHIPSALLTNTLPCMDTSLAIQGYTQGTGVLT